MIKEQNNELLQVLSTQVATARIFVEIISESLTESPSKSDEQVQSVQAALNALKKMSQTLQNHHRKTAEPSHTAAAKPITESKPMRATNQAEITRTGRSRVITTRLWMAPNK